VQSPGRWAVPNRSGQVRRRFEMWKKILGILVAVSLTAAGAGVAFAQGKGYVKKKVFDFEGDNIEGALLTPEGEFLGGRVRPTHKSLIEYRLDFVPEMLKTAEDI
jgi:hypothetical protein